MLQRIICSGFGGQGVLTTGLLLAYALNKNGHRITWYPSYGSEMRGGTANCMIKASDEEIASPFVKEIDILITLNEPAIVKFEESIVPGGYLFVNSSIVHDREYRSDINVIQVDTKELAQKANNPKGDNIAMLGAVLKTTQLLNLSDFELSMGQYFKEKGKEAFAEINRQALISGYDAC